MLDLGVKAQVDFRGHHGDPDRYGVDNPQLSYLNIKAGPYVQVNVGEYVHFNFEGGYYLYRRFSFSDGSDEKESITLDNVFYFKGGFYLGI